MNIDQIRSAAKLISPYVKSTTLEFSSSLSKRVGVPIYVKYELFQKTGSFKVRGAFNKLLNLDEQDRARGVVAVSGGNHAQAVAYASSILGVRSIILMAENTPAGYVSATRNYGAAVELVPTIADAFERVKDHEAKGRIFVHPFDDEQIMAGAGTVGIEILDDLPDVTDVVVSIGGGGLAGGVSTAIKSMNKDIRIWGVETTGADAMSQALAAGRPVELPAITSIAKTLGAPYVSERTLSLVQNNLESVTIVSDDEAIEAVVYIAERLKVMTEPAAACTLIASEKLRSSFFTSSSKIALIFCGGNISISDLCGYRISHGSLL